MPVRTPVLTDPRYQPGALIHSTTCLFEVIELEETAREGGYRFLRVRNESNGKEESYGVEYVARAFTLLRAAPEIPDVVPVAA